MPREHRSIAKKRYRSWKKARQGIVSSIENINDELKLKSQIEQLFVNMDVDESQGIDANELRIGMKGIGIELSDVQANELLNEADADGDGFVDYNEFEFVIMNQIMCYKRDQAPLCRCVVQ
jgi:Ca2+-binding EF-hand superfamily protein